MNANLKRTIEEAVLPPLVALVVALIVGDLLILAYGQAPSAVWRLLIDGTWGNAYGFGQVLYKATTLTCTGLAVAMSLRAGLFNIGAEGQLAAGGFGAGLGGRALASGHTGVPRRSDLRDGRDALWRTGRRRPGSASRKVRRARSDRDDHAQLYCACPAQLFRLGQAPRP